MKKNIVFRIIACIILCATLFGSFSFMTLNKDVEAAENYPYKRYNGAKICSHTQVNLIVNRENTGDEYDTNTMAIQIQSNNGTKYSHIHKHTFSYFLGNLGEVNKDEIYTKKNGYHYRTSLEGGFGSNPQYRLFYRGGKCYIKPITQANYSPTPTSQYAWKWGFQKCSECALNRTAPNSTITLKCPCCSKTATINPLTGDIK